MLNNYKTKRSPINKDDPIEKNGKRIWAEESEERMQIVCVYRPENITS